MLGDCVLCIGFLQVLLDITGKAGLAKAAYTFNKHQVGSQQLMQTPAQQQ